jgi:hypothetical protein
MALFINGMPCRLCGKAMNQADDVIMFPAFLGRSHPLHKYSDGVFHRSCFEAVPDKKDMELALARFRDIWDRRPQDIKTIEEFEAWGRSAFAEFH